jgi:hypothetical protein
MGCQIRRTIGEALNLSADALGLAARSARDLEWA